MRGPGRTLRTRGLAAIRRAVGAAPWALAAVALSPWAGCLAAAGDAFPVPGISYAPRHYLCYRASAPLVIDGRLNEPAWMEAAWTDAFVDIEGSLKPSPRCQTRAKMLWDQDYLYVAAVLEEPDLWGTLRERDSVIFHDPDFELFIDPDADTHEYYELEINSLGTVWDLMLIRPYRDGGPAVNAWDIQGLKSAVSCRGTLNQPADRDTGWTVELALPWMVLAECAHRDSPPRDGDAWKVNFSRVEWRLEARDGAYLKRKDPSGRKELAEDNWVWSPQGLVAMHYPEMWGWVQFSTAYPGAGAVSFTLPRGDAASWALRRLYYAERRFREEHARYCASAESLGLPPFSDPDYAWPPAIEVTRDLFQARLPETKGGGYLSLTQDGRLLALSAARSRITGGE